MPKTRLLLVIALLLAVAMPTAAQSESCPKWALPISYNQVVNGALDNITYAEVYCFNGQAGDQITIDLSATSGNLDTNLILSDLTGDTVYASNDDIVSGNLNSQVVVTLPTTGIYMITATRFDMETGTTSGGFTLALSSAPAAPVNTNLFTTADCPTGTQPITYNETLSGQISKADYIFGYCFIGGAGDIVTISLNATSGNLDTYLLLTDDEFVEEYGRNDDVASGNTNSQLIVTLPENNVYVIGVSRYDLEAGQTAGTYDLNLSAQVAAAPVTSPSGKGSTPQAPSSSASAVSNSGAVLSCDQPPLSDLLRGEWYMDDEAERLTFNFECSGQLTISIGKEDFDTTYTYQNNIITIDLGSAEAPLVLTDVVIAADVMMAVNQETGALVLLINTLAELEGQ